MNSLFLLFILACPLMMFFMMRGMHGGHGGSADKNTSVDELRRQRDELDRQIEQHETEEQMPVKSGWR
jgi:hypothetical protein